MIGYKELNAIRGAMQQVAEGSYKKASAPQPEWIADGITADQVGAYTNAIKEAYSTDSSEFEFAGKKYSVSFVKADKSVSIKPGLYGKTDVLVGSHRVRSFNEVRQARVYAAQLTESHKRESKVQFSVSLIASVSAVSE